MRVLGLMTLMIFLQHESGLARDAIVLVENGKALVSLEIEKGSGPDLQDAAADLAAYIKKMSGADIGKSTGASGHIYLGRSFSKFFGVNLDELVPGEYTIKTKGKDILIAGPDERGTINGIYGFMSDYLGIRWYGPGELFEVVPVRKSISVPQIDVRSRPSFLFRIYSGIVGTEGQEWLRRNRMDRASPGLPFFGFGHNLENIFPPSKYGKEHPEYYAMVDGRRLVPEKDGANRSQPCFSNPEVAEIAAAEAKRFFDANPSYTTFSLCVNDNMDFCRCPECQKLDSPRRTSKGWPIYSDSYFNFVERVARKVAKTNPGRYLGCYAYWGVELPPRNIKRLPENVVVALTQDTSQHLDPDYKRADRELWLEWSRVAQHLAKYDYYGLGWLTPRVFPTLAADDLKFIHANGAIGFYCEAYPLYYMTAPQLYLATQLLWKIDGDPEIILNSYFRDLYGPAASDMRAFYAALERYWMRPRTGRWFQGLENIHQELEIADPSILEDARKCLVAARQKVIGTELQRVQYIEAGFRFSCAIVKAFHRGSSLDKMPLASERDIAAIVAEIEAALGEIRVAEDTYKNVISRDPLQRHTYYIGERFDRKFRTWMECTADGLRKAIARLREASRKIIPSDAAHIIIDDLRARLSQDPIAQRLGLAEVE